jgi:DNA-directed RNA polymerase specialized sigma24 family protein
MQDDSSFSRPRFPPTRQSAVLAVASHDAAARARSFDVLVRAYWKPVYAHVRTKWNRAPDQAQDLTQGFFAHAFEKRYFSDYDPAKARFRTYLRTCLDRFVMTEQRDARREKRGSGAPHLSLDFPSAENELRSLGVLGSTDTERCFDDAWTRHLLSVGLDQLKRTCSEKDKEVAFQVFDRYVLSGEPRSYADLASELAIPVTQVTNHLAWARREFRRIVLEQLREITASDEEFRSEARALLGVDP